MKRPVLRMMMGLPASGKSTAAKQLVADGTKDAAWVQVEKDIIRKNTKLFEGGVYNYERGDEAIVIRERNRQIREGLDNGYSVVVSDCNLSSKHRGQMRTLATECGVDLEIDRSFLKVPVSECIERDAKRDVSVGKEAILKMYYKYVHPGFHQRHPDWKDKLPRAYIFDIDGTLAFLGERSPRDTETVGDDTPNYALMHIIDALSLFTDENARKYTKYTHVVLITGRKEAARENTVQWLDRWGIYYDELIMRPDDDHRKDFVLKREIYDQRIKGKYNVMGVFEDRPQVVDMWRRELGLMVFQLADHDVKF